MKYGNLYDGSLGQVRVKSIFLIIGNFFQILMEADLSHLLICHLTVKGVSIAIQPCDPS